MVQESFKALKNTNINPLITSYKTAPSPRAVFLSLYFAKGARSEPHRQKTLSKVRAAQVRNFEIFYKRDNQSFLEYVV